MNSARNLHAREFRTTLGALGQGVMINVATPSLLRANGLRNPTNGDPDFGSLALHIAPNVPDSQANAMPFSGNCIYLPADGEYRLFRTFAGQPSGSGTVSIATAVVFSIFENYTPSDWAEFVSNLVPTYVATVNTAVAAGTTVALSAQGAADQWYPGGVQIINGAYFRIFGAIVTNAGANDCWISCGNGLNGTNVGILLTAGQTYTFQPGSITGMSALYAFSTAGTTVSVTWSIK